jgi:hypothetical protein
MTRMMAIDPGESGGMAWLDEDGTVQAAPMPAGMTVQIDAMRALVASGCRRVVLEKVGSFRPGNGGVSACKFARHCGNLEAAAYTMGAEQVAVAPQTWQKAMGALPKEKAERKRAIREEMSRRYPHLAVTLKTADALGILTWAIGDR